MFYHILQLTAQTERFLESHLPTKLYRICDVLTALLVDLLRLCAGRFVARGLAACNRPAQPLKYFDYEPSRACRKVRETLSCLDLDHFVYPCSRDTLKARGVSNGNRYRDELMKDGGKIQLPFLVDPNTDVKLYESSEIVNYLWATYGNNAQAPWNYRLCVFTRWEVISANLAVLLRPRIDKNGVMKIPSKQPEQPLELWGYESSCFVRLVREKLSSLGLAYLYHEVPMGAEEKRKAFIKAHGNQIAPFRQRIGIIQVPYLHDPNTERCMFESLDIVNYLTNEYQTSKDIKITEKWTDFVPATSN